MSKPKTVDPTPSKPRSADPAHPAGPVPKRAKQKPGGKVMGGKPKKSGKTGSKPKPGSKPKGAPKRPKLKMTYAYTKTTVKRGYYAMTEALKADDAEQRRKEKKP